MQAGDEVSDFELPDQYGRPVRLSKLLADGPVVLFFYPAASSSGCTKESCHFRDLGEEYAAAGVHRIGISMDTIDAQRAFSDVNSFDYPLLSDLDGEVAAAFGVKRRIKAIPVKRKTFVIGTDARVVDVVSSEFNMDVHADQALSIARTAD